MSEEPQESTTCRICGKTLTAPESVKKGIGPVCESRLKKVKEKEEEAE